MPNGTQLLSKTSLLIIFVKNPVLGGVKTRLAETAGDLQALMVYQQLLQHTWQITAPLPCTKWICYSQFIDQDDEWTSPPYEKHLQAGDDLGQRMQQIFHLAFARAYQYVLIIGSDCLELSTEHLYEGFEKLQEPQTDMVIGPATDGGYYLLGMKQPQSSLFENIAWSTPEVLAQTLDIARQRKLTSALLPALTDIDTYQDWLLCGGESLI